MQHICDVVVIGNNFFFHKFNDMGPLMHLIYTQVFERLNERTMGGFFYLLVVVNH
jgi:hypothetical protein